MIKFFRTSYPIQYFVVLFSAFILWLPQFIFRSIPEAPIHDAPLYELMSSLLAFSPFFKTLVAFLLLLLEAIFFNSILVVNQFIPRNSSIGAFVFVIMMSCVPSLTTFHPFILALLPLLALVNTMFLVYHTQKPEVYLLNAGFFTAIASMLYFPSIVLILWVLILIYLFGEKDLRYYFIPIVGLIIPYFLLFAIYNSMEIWPELVSAWKQTFSEYHITFSHFSTNDWVTLSILVFLLIVSTSPLRRGVIDNTIVIRKKITSQWFLFIFALFMLFYYDSWTSNGLILLICSVFYSIVFGNVRKTRLANVVLLLICIAVVLNQYYPIIISLLR